MIVASMWTGMGSTAFNVLLVLHLASVVVALGPTFVFSELGRQARRRTGEAGAAFAEIAATLAMRSTLPALLVAAMTGVGMIADSDGFYEMSAPWVSAAFSLVVGLVLLVAFVVAPSQRRLAEAVRQGSEDGVRQAKALGAMSTGIAHLAFAALLVLMVWRPS